MSEVDKSVDVADVLRSIADLAAPLEREAVLAQVGRVAAEAIGGDLGFLGLLEDKEHMKLTEVHGSSSGVLERLRVKRGLGLGGKVLTLGKPFCLEDYLTADSISHEYDAEIAEEGLRGIICLPLVVNHELLGVVYVSNRAPKIYSDIMIDQLLTTVEAAKLALSMADRSRELTDAAVEVEKRRTLDVLDSSLSGHLANIAATAKSIAADPTSSQDLIERASSIITSVNSASTLFGNHELPQRTFAARDDFGLTPRELEVIRLASRGFSNPEIGDRLFLARGTVKAYMEAALRKLRARNRVEAVMIAARSGLLDDL